MRRAVVLVLDGLRRDMLTEALTPILWRTHANPRLSRRTARCFPPPRAWSRRVSRPAAIQQSMSCKETALC